jgi:quercetin dioxygenase-like cupin family protein
VPLMLALERQRFSERGPRPQVLHMGDHLAVMLLCLQGGQELRAPEGDATETLFCVLAGDGEIVEGGERHAVGVGDVVVVPAGTPKALVANSGTMSVLGVRHLGAPDA